MASTSTRRDRDGRDDGPGLELSREELEQVKERLRADPRQRLRWRVLERFGALPSEERVRNMRDQDYLWCLANDLLDREEELERLCPSCQARALEERCPVCGQPGQEREEAVDPAFDFARFRELGGAAASGGEGTAELEELSAGAPAEGQAPASGDRSRGEAEGGAPEGASPLLDQLERLERALSFWSASVRRRVPSAGSEAERAERQDGYPLTLPGPGKSALPPDIAGMGTAGWTPVGALEETGAPAADEMRWVERADRIFRRDSRRYDGGFYLY